MFKNVASQKILVFAWDTVSEAAKTGDAAQISAQISKDCGASAATDDVNPTELDATDHPGVYFFDILQEESNADMVIVSAVSATDNIILRPVIIYTRPVAPTSAEFELRTLPSAEYVVVGDTIAGVTTCTTNSDLVTAAAIKTALEADGGDLSSLMEALVNKRI